MSPPSIQHLRHPLVAVSSDEDKVDCHKLRRSSWSSWKFRTAASLPMYANFNNSNEGSARAFWVELSPNLFGGQSLDQRLSHFDACLRDGRGAALWNESCKKSLEFSNRMTGEDIVKICQYSGMAAHAEKMIFVMKMGVALASCGYCSIEVELLLKEVCSGMGLPLNKIDHGPGRLQASFGTAPPFFVRTNSGVQADKLTALVKLAFFASSGNVDARAATLTLEEILQRPKPYGQAVHMMAFFVVNTLTSVTVRMGNWEDAFATACITPFVILVIKLFEHGVKVPDAIDFMVPFTTGMGASIVWRWVEPISACHVPIWYLSVLMDFLPGAQLVYAAYEFEFSSVINSASRLIRALLQCMLLALGTVLGWQIFGHNLDSDRESTTAAAIASLPPAVECNNLEYKHDHWMLAYVVLNVPMVMALIIGTNLRLRDAAGTFFVCYLSLLVYGFLTWAQVIAFPPAVINVLCVFIAGNLGSALEYLDGPPSTVSVLPAILFLAPGGPCVKSMLQGMRNTISDGVSFADLWQGLVLEGLSYAVGLHLAVSIWRPLVMKRTRQRAQNSLEAMSLADLRV